MKQATPTKRRLWLVAVVAILVAMACMFTACDNAEEPDPTEPVTSELYWNLDKALYTDSELGLSTRERAEDGLYHFRFVSAGKLVELTTADAQIVNYLDTMEVMGLILDADGSIIDAIPVAELATELAKEFFVKSVKGNTIQLNSSPAMNGMDVNFELTDAAHVMDVRPDSDNPGQAVTLDVMDSVWVYTDMDNVVTNVFLSKRPPASEFYVRIDRFYANGETTRVPDENGIYTIPFAVNGQIVELKCKDKDLVSSIDSGTDTGAHMGLVFDEEGYIIEDMSGAEALRCAATAIVFHVKEINGDQVTFVRRLSGNNQGQEVTVTVNENTQIINTEDAYMSSASCWAFDHVGQLTDHLEVNDRVICYADSDGNAKVITILCRMVDSKMYFNEKVQYSSAKKETTRVKDESGYYVFKFACEGKSVTLKTKSKAIASEVDSYSAGIVGLKVSGSIIKDVCSPYCVAGNLTTAKLIARDMLGTVVTLTSRWEINNVGGNYVVADDCKIFDVSGNYGVKFGAKTTIKVGDHVYGVRNPDNNLAYVFVTKRLVSGTKLYYNTWRRFNTTTNETTRPADEEGYYVYDLLTETGKLVQGKTKDKKMADFIDLQLSPFVSLKIDSKGIITKAAFCEASLQWGMKYTNYHYIKSIDYKNKTYSTYYMSEGKKVDSYTDVPFADNVKMYNFSVNFKDYRGEKTKVRVDDRIQAFYDAGQNKVSHIYVLERTDPEVKKLCPHCNKKVTFYGLKSGAAPAGVTTHYYIENSRSLSQITVGATKVDNDPKQKRTTVVIDLNGKTLSGSTSRVALVYGDLFIVDTKGGGGVTGNCNNSWGGAFLLRENGTLTLKSGTYTYSADEKYAGASIGGIFYLSENSVLNIEKGVKVTAGRSNGNGGLIYMDMKSTVNVNGAELSAGNAAGNGGNIYMTGNATFNMNSGSLLSGSAKLGNNVYIASKTAAFNLGEGVTFDGGLGFGAAINYPITGKVEWTSPVVLRNGAKLDLTGMDPTSKLAIDAEGVFTTDFADAATAKTYLNCFTVPQDYKPVEVKGKALSTELEVEKLIEREMAVANAVKDLNPAEVVSGTTCPMCGAENITWSKKTGGFWASGKTHIYYEGALGTAAEPLVVENFLAGDEGATICMVMLDADIHTTGRILLRPNNIFNIMGTGTITSDGTSITSTKPVISDRGLFNFVGANAELNLYGGNYQYTGTGFGKKADGTIENENKATFALMNIYANSVANIFNDTVIGPAEKNTEVASYNAYVLGTLNMFGGTIQNGVSKSDQSAGNVTLYSSGALNMYGGTIKDGVAQLRGGNILMHTGTAMTMEADDALVTGGTSNNGGGNIAIVNTYLSSGKTTLSASVSKFVLNKGTISNGSVTTKSDFNGGGNMYIWSSAAGQFDINGGTITAGTAFVGGNIYARNTNTTVNIGKNAVISDGKADQYGGNISLFNTASAISEGSIINGTAALGGGNVNLGHSSGAYNTFTMNGGEISGGTVTGKAGQNFGGNVRLWDNSQFTMNDGYVYGGFVDQATYHHNSSNFMVGGSSQAKVAKLIINGGHIAGDIKVYRNSAGTINGSVTLTGAPEILTTITLADGQTTANSKFSGMLIQSGNTIDISGLKPEAKIAVSVVENQVFTAASDNAEAVAGCFTTTNAALTVEATAEKVLKAVTAPVTPAPEPTPDPAPAA